MNVEDVEKVEEAEKGVEDVGMEKGVEEVNDADENPVKGVVENENAGVVAVAVVVNAEVNEELGLKTDAGNVEEVVDVVEEKADEADGGPEMEGNGLKAEGVKAAAEKVKLEGPPGTAGIFVAKGPAPKPNLSPKL